MPKRQINHHYKVKVLKCVRNYYSTIITGIVFLSHYALSDIGIHLFGSFRELLNSELFVEVSSDEEEVDAGSEPDEGVRDPNNHNLLFLFVSPLLRAVLASIAHWRRHGGESSGPIH